MGQILYESVRVQLNGEGVCACVRMVNYALGYLYVAGWPAQWP